MGAPNRLAPAGAPRFDAGHWMLPHEDLLGFIEVPAGKFLMGSDDLTDDEGPLHEVDLPQFWMARYPTTVAQFRAFVEGSEHVGFAAEALRSPDDQPVAHVSWSDALRYCEWLNGKLVGLAKERNGSGDPWQGLENGTLRARDGWAHLSVG
jgi:formylglycine-generating enzyme required for sulfatase activity